MRKSTQTEFAQVQKTAAGNYSVDVSNVSSGKSFSVGAPGETKLLAAVQQTSSFLGRINVLQVTDKQGAKVFGAVSGTMTGRKAGGRYMGEMNPDGNEYQCVETDTGVAMPWPLLDQWGRLKGRMLKLYGSFVQTQLGLDMMMIGWHGTSAAKTTNKASNPKLQDVNKGWLQWMRDNKSENILEEGATTDKIKLFGTGADYLNLDAAVYDLKQGLGEAHRERGDLIVFVGADLIAKEAELVSKSHGLTPTERAATKQHELMGTFGGLPAETPPNFPAKGLVITTYGNLSVYIQEGSWRRGIKDNDDKAQVEDKNWRNECYVVEDEDCFVGWEHDNVEFTTT